MARQASEVVDYAADHYADSLCKISNGGSFKAVDVLSQYGRLLFGIAYRMLGSVQDAEDMVQETYLRWLQVKDVAVDSPQAYLCTVVTRLCIDHLRSARVRREQYVGPWLPEPLVTQRGRDLSEVVAQNESITTALLLLLERQSPVERAVFVLHEVFGYEYADVAKVVARSPANCRQIMRRARQKLEAAADPTADQQGQAEMIASSFLHSCVTGDLEQLLALLAPNVVALSDGGGIVTAARNPIVGSDAVARFVLGLARVGVDGLAVHVVQVNGRPGFVFEVQKRVYGVLSFETRDARIVGLYLVLNPEKLGRVSVDA